MSTPLRVVAFVTALVAAFAVAWGAGAVVGPESGDLSASASEHTGHRVERLNGNAGTPPREVADVGGLTARADGFTLALAGREVAAGGTYTVSLEGDTAPGASTVLTTRIELDGEPVTDLEPYLGAFGHLVAIRAGDLAYLHVHPEKGEPGPGIDFTTAFPEPATYGLFLDFQHRGTVRPAAFTVESGGAPSGDHAEGGDHDH
jgi:hypothetical protein